MMRSARAGSTLLTRMTCRSLNVSRRSFAASTAARAGIIDDLYIKELKNYKVPQEKASDAEGVVQKFNPPAVPKSPEEGNLANEMQDYENSTVEIEGQAAAGETQSAEGDYFEDLKEFDEEPAHH